MKKKVKIIINRKMHREGDERRKASSSLYIILRWCLSFESIESICYSCNIEIVLQRMQNQEIGLILSADAKLRLKWTSELHRRFVEAVIQLGGAEKATPKTLKRAMGIPWITLYHLKSHLQKYRLGKKQQLEACGDDKEVITDTFKAYYIDGHMSGDHVNNLQIAHALKLQMEVQRKQEQIEVQRQLQLRIDAQSKYLESLLKKARKTIAGSGYSSMGHEYSKTEHFKLASIVENHFPGFSYSELAETEGSSLKVEKISSMKELNANGNHPWKTFLNGHTGGRKRPGSANYDGNCVENSPTKQSPIHKVELDSQLRKCEPSERLDLNCQYQNEINPGRE